MSFVLGLPANGCVLGPVTPFKHDPKAAEIVTKAVTAIVLDDPFYGYLLLRMEIIQAPVGTACTNGKWIKYDPKFVRSLTLPQVKGLLKHEVMHVAHMHHVRRGNRDPERWNQAGDYVINAHLLDQEVDLPPNGLVDPKYVDYSTERAYDSLPPGGGGGGGGNQPGWNWGGVEDAPGIEEEDVRRQVEQDTLTDVINAHNTAKLFGKLPAGIDRLVGKLRESKMPWRQILARWFKSSAKSDYSWMRPNRRFLANNIYLPSLYSEAMGPVAIVVDTSGSIQGEMLDEFFGCINSLIKHCRPEKTVVIYCDADVGGVQTFKPEQYPLSANSFKPSGGGGTDFRPPFEYLALNKIKPEVVLYLTDMFGTFPDKAPAYPVIWCATSDVKAPFGKTLELR